MISPLLRTAAATGLMLLAWGQAFAADATRPASAKIALPQAPPVPPVGEYEAKARYVTLLPAYITWPRGNGQDGRPRIIGIVGECPFKDQLNEIFAPGKSMFRKNRLVYLSNFRDIETCDALFICESESERLYEILRRIKGRPILTLGDSPDFARRGVMINLFLDRDRIGFEVNLPSLRLSGLEVSPHLLKNAKIIE